MNLKKAMPTQIDRDVLRAVVHPVDLDDVDPRSHDGMPATAGRARRAIGAIQLEFVRDDVLESACGSVGVDRPGAGRNLPNDCFGLKIEGREGLRVEKRRGQP